MSARRDLCDPPAASIRVFGTSDVMRVGKRGGERSGERCIKRFESLGRFEGQLSSVSDGDRDGEYPDWRGGVRPSDKRILLR